MSENYAKEYNDYMHRIITRKQELIKQLSEIDLAQQDILHFLEFEKCNAVTMVKLTKKLKSIRTERREIKETLDILMTIHCKLGSKTIPETKDKTYTYKTKVMKEIVG